MNRTYPVINGLLEQNRISAEVAEQVIEDSRQSGKPSLFHLINEHAVDPASVTEILRRSGEEQCVCPKCDGAGEMSPEKGDGECFLCKRAGLVTLEEALGWLNQNRCIPGFDLFPES